MPRPTIRKVSSRKFSSEKAIHLLRSIRLRGTTVLQRTQVRHHRVPQKIETLPEVKASAAMTSKRRN